MSNARCCNALTAPTVRLVTFATTSISEIRILGESRIRSLTSDLPLTFRSFLEMLRCQTNFRSTAYKNSGEP